MSPRLPIVAGNWKMHCTIGETMELCGSLRARLDRIDGVVKVVCPPFLSLWAAREILQGSSLQVGAQNLHWAEKGAYTGEISPLMLKGVCDYVIIGHSERRTYFCETDEVVGQKVRAALAAGLKPILCVGEILAEREEGRTQEVLTRQLRLALADVQLPDGFVIAYEPVWAIGTGRPASGEMAQEAIAFIRQQVAELHGPEKAASLRVQYGGSVTAENIGEFVRQPDIDGALVGGASLNAEAFAAIVAITAQAKRR